MLNLAWWEWGLLAVGAYVALVTLARLMRNRREELFAILSRQAAEEQQHKRREEKLRRKREREAERLKLLEQAKRKAA